MNLNKYGRCVEAEWQKTKLIRSYIELDEYVIMPNHFHAIIIFKPHDAAISGPAKKMTLVPDSLGSVIGQFKSVVTKQIRRMGQVDFKWQRNYYEHIIRNEIELFNIRQYIKNNPLKWDNRVW